MKLAATHVGTPTFERGTVHHFLVPTFVIARELCALNLCDTRDEK